MNLAKRVMSSKELPVPFLREAETSVNFSTEFTLSRVEVVEMMAVAMTCVVLGMSGRKFTAKKMSLIN